MAAPETVRVYTVDENSDPLEGVLVRFFDGTDTFVTQQYSSLIGAESYAEVTIDGDDPAIEYTIRLGKNTVAFDGGLGDDSKTPQSILIYSPATLSPTGTNYFQVQGQTFTRPVATDPRLCRCSGFFVDPTGQPLPNLDIHFVHRCVTDNLNPLIVDGKAVLGSKVFGRTDANGYFEIDLFRTGEYSALVESLENIQREIRVPNLPSANLIDILFPVVKSITFDVDPVTVAVDGYVDVTMIIVASSGSLLNSTSRDVLFESSDTSIATVQHLSSGLLRIVGVSAGSTTILATRADTTIKTIPEEDIENTPLSVTVI